MTLAWGTKTTRDRHRQILYSRRTVAQAEDVGFYMQVLPTFLRPPSAQPSQTGHEAAGSLLSILNSPQRVLKRGGGAKQSSLSFETMCTNLVCNVALVPRVFFLGFFCSPIPAREPVSLFPWAPLRSGEPCAVTGADLVFAVVTWPVLTADPRTSSTHAARVRVTKIA